MPQQRTIVGTFVEMLATSLADEPGGAMAYSNVGYLILGVVVEAVTRADYESHCRAAALAPAGASGFIEPTLRWRAPNGGWVVSAIDYARFIQVFDPGSPVLGAKSRRWLASRATTYGLGMIMDRTARGTIFSHSGRVASRGRGGSYAVRFDDGWTVVVLFGGDLSREGYGDLRTLILRVPAAGRR